MTNHAPVSRRRLGFSLIELMVAVAIIGLLSSIAYPSYVEYVQRSRRAEARTILLDAAQFMQRYYASNDTYVGAALPANLSRSPPAGADQYYAISIAAGASRTAYSLQAVPQGTMSGDSCGTLTVDSRGRRGAGGDVTKCWK